MNEALFQNAQRVQENLAQQFIISTPFQLCGVSLE
jgi:hypothetical protein